MSDRRRARAEMTAKLELLAAMIIVNDDDNVDVSQREAWCARVLGLREVPDANGWARVLTEMCYRLWLRTDDPIHVWKALMICRQRGLGVPLWVDSYLAQITARIIAPHGLRGDVGRALQRILGFRRKPGRRRGPVNEANRVVLVTGFARAIMDGAEPEIALARARDGLDMEWAYKDTRTLLACIRQSFDIRGAIRTRAQWEAGIAAWFKRLARLDKAQR